MATCSKCKRDVGCACNLVNGLCSSCGPQITYVATQPSNKSQIQKQSCEITLSFLELLEQKLNCVINTRTNDAINEVFQNVINIKAVVTATKDLPDYCVNRPFIQLAEQILVKINQFTTC